MLSNSKKKKKRTINNNFKKNIQSSIHKCIQYVIKSYTFTNLPEYFTLGYFIDICITMHTLSYLNIAYAIKVKLVIHSQY